MIKDIVYVVKEIIELTTGKVKQQAKSKTMVVNSTLAAALPVALAYLAPVLTKKEFAITAACMVLGTALVNMILRQVTHQAIKDK